MLAVSPANRVAIHLNANMFSRSYFLSREIVSLILKQGLARATVLHPEAEFGSHHRMHTLDGGIDTAQNVPIRIEFIDAVQGVERLLPLFQELVTNGPIVAQEPVIAKVAIGPTR